MTSADFKKEEVPKCLDEEIVYITGTSIGIDIVIDTTIKNIKHCISEVNGFELEYKQKLYNAIYTELKKVDPVELLSNANTGNIMAKELYQNLVDDLLVLYVLRFLLHGTKIPIVNNKIIEEYISKKNI